MLDKSVGLWAYFFHRCIVGRHRIEELDHHMQNRDMRDRLVAWWACFRHGIVGRHRNEELNLHMRARSCWSCPCHTVVTNRCNK